MPNERVNEILEAHAMLAKLDMTMRTDIKKFGVVGSLTMKSGRGELSITSDGDGECDFCIVSDKAAEMLDWIETGWNTWNVVFLEMSNTIIGRLEECDVEQAVRHFRHLED
jgi:hypothetical protein